MISTLWLKRCRRCGGDLFLEQDAYGTYVSCLQCGAVAGELVEPVRARPAPQMLELVETGEHAA